MYSKKVMEYFMHPHNMGEIKDADGIGKVGNPICLSPRQNIHVNSDLKEIDKISENFRVLSHNGEYNLVSKIVEREYAGEILVIKNKLGKVDLTPDHLVLGIKIPKGDIFLRTKNKKKLVSAWHHAKNLTKGDIILYPILKKEKDLEYLEVNIPKPKWDFKSREIPNKIPLNSELLRLFGYFLSEGNIQDKPCRTFISFTLNIRENEIAEDIKEISKRIFDLDVITKRLPKRKTLLVYLYSAKVTRLFKRLFGEGAKNKSIPDFIMNLPPEKQKSLIYGLWKGDGYVNLNRDGARAGYSTISYILAQQIKILLLRQKIVPSIYKEEEKEIKGVRHKKSYRIHVGQRDSLIKICSILCIKYNPKSYASEKSWFDDNFLYIPITGIKRKEYAGKVYNLEVHDSHSFVSEAFCLHNCGDVMWVYIKVNKDKKGKEKISDIKFQTFGCAAAIATSSMITDLAKGKTLDDAMNITRNDVSDALGNLPPIKEHCSNLAADALHSAIADYRNKSKKNKA
jgi:nitrogen fixation NifU-like protein